jgi:hypothetical protein
MIENPIALYLKTVKRPSGNAIMASLAASSSDVRLFSDNSTERQPPQNPRKF